ncbi:MAG: hypothetical protein V7744_11890 [Pseudomonadales bacterium]
MKKFIFMRLLIICAGLTTMQVNAQVDITVNTLTVIANDVGTKYGINLNAGIDSDLNRAKGYTPLVDVLSSLGVKHLRYPGGKKSLYYAWSTHPFTDANTSYWVPSWYEKAAKNTLDFDAFMLIAKQVGAEPHINVAYNPQHNLGAELAAAWVKYANITHNYNIKYWEIGNEMWQKDLGFNIKTLCTLANTYALTMKAEDPSILIGISWRKNQVQKVINNCGNAIDFVAISDYTNYQGSYKSYADTNNAKLIGVNESATKRIIVSEFAPSTWTKNTEDLANDTGKGIINFDQIGQYLTSPNTEYAAFWNTHWYDLSNTPRDAMDNANNLLPVALPMTLWARYIKNQLVEIRNNHSDIVTYAAYDQDSGNLNLFIINKGMNAHQTKIKINAKYSYKAKALVERFQGKSALDKQPTLSVEEDADLSNNTINTVLPPTSISLFSLLANEFVAKRIR